MDPYQLSVQMAPILGMYFSFTLLVLFLFGAVLEAANLDVKHPPKGSLKVRLDYGLATQSNSPEESKHRWVYSSYLEFNEEVSSITDGQLRMMVQNAHKEMEDDMMQYEPDEPVGNDPYGIIPSAMTIMAFGNKIILSSSQRGTSGFINGWPNSPVKLSLDRCSALYRDRVIADPTNNANPYQDHKNRAKCGEVNAFHQYYMTNDKPISELDPKARVTTVLKTPRGYTLVPPCPRNTRESWGCNLLVQDQNVKYLLDDVKKRGYGLGKIAGGVKRIGQIQMCIKNKIIWDGEEGG